MPTRGHLESFALEVSLISRVHLKDTEQVAAVTYFWDRVRGIAGGINEAVMGTFALLIAIRVYDASSLAKSAINGSVWAGIFLTPVFLWIVSRLRLRCNVACAVFPAIAASCMLLCAFSKQMESYVVLVCIAMVLGVQGFTLLPRIFAENYDSKTRGKRVGTSFMISGIVFILFSQAFGFILDKSLENYGWILASSSFASYLAALCYLRMPSRRLRKPASRFPYHTLRLFWQNHRFTKIALLWALIEFGGFMVFPIRMEYVAAEVYGLNFSNSQVTWLLAIVPLSFSLISTRLWGRLFDAFDVPTIQAAMGGFLILNILLFFNSSNYWFLLFSMSFFGLSLGAQKILGQLWITKVVETELVAEYLSATSTLNGLRGILAPIFAYWLLSLSDPRIVGYAAAAIIGLAVFGLLMQGSIDRNQNPEDRVA